MFVFGLDVKDIYCALGSILLLVKEKSLVGLFWLWSRHVTRNELGVVIFADYGPSSEAGVSLINRFHVCPSGLPVTLYS